MRKLQTFIVALICAALFSVHQADAAPACYTLDEAAAEQGLRIHSELMVIGLNCQHMARAAGNKNLYMRYREFTAAHSKIFAGYEERLMQYYRRQGARDPEARLNTLRTDLANKVSKDAARMRPDLFCKRYAPRVEKAAQMNDAAIRRWAATFYPSYPVSQPICKSKK